MTIAAKLLASIQWQIHMNLLYGYAHDSDQWHQLLGSDREGSFSLTAAPISNSQTTTICWSRNEGMIRFQLTESKPKPTLEFIYDSQEKLYSLVFRQEVPAGTTSWLSKYCKYSLTEKPGVPYEAAFTFSHIPDAVIVAIATKYGLSCK